jgi:hypothetical protein
MQAATKRNQQACSLHLDRKLKTRINNKAKARGIRVEVLGLLQEDCLERSHPCLDRIQVDSVVAPALLAGLEAVRLEMQRTLLARSLVKLRVPLRERRRMQLVDTRQEDFRRLEEARLAAVGPLLAALVQVRRRLVEVRLDQQVHLEPAHSVLVRWEGAPQ